MKSNHSHLLPVLAMLVFPLSVFAGPIVTDVVAKQRYPWNGKVDISCIVSEMPAGQKWTFVVSSVNPDSGAVAAAQSVKIVRDDSETDDLSFSSNGTYRFIWDAAADLGEVHFTNMIVRVSPSPLATIVEAGHRGIQLWEGGPYWAETNVGAENPWDFGYYFWWGDTVGYKREGTAWVATDGSNNNFSFSGGNVPTYGKDSGTLRSEGWIDASGNLAPEHDAAHIHWGGGAWRMPTAEKIDALARNTTTSWITTNGVKGRLVRGNGDYATKSIFLPAAGYGDGTSLNDSGSDGYYWSSSPNSDSSPSAWNLLFYSGDFSRLYDCRYYGQSVRALRGFAE